ncbi:MAG: hypothetical protein ACYC0F_19120, partial [Rhodanobacter sp.]
MTENQVETIKNRGRPKVYTPEVLESLATELLDWVMKPTSTMLIGFTNEKLLPPSRITEWAKASETFSLALSTAKAIIAQRREDLFNQGKILTASYHMYQRFNDPLVNQHFRDEFSFEANIKEKAKSDHNTAN